MVYFTLIFDTTVSGSRFFFDLYIHEILIPHSIVGENLPFLKVVNLISVQFQYLQHGERNSFFNVLRNAILSIDHILHEISSSYTILYAFLLRLSD